jgi:hypothetical protein
VGGSATSLRIIFVLVSGGTASRVSYAAHAQIDGASFPSSHIVNTSGSGGQTRSASTLTAVASNPPYPWNDQGTMLFRVKPFWLTADAPTNRTLFTLTHASGQHEERVFYDMTAGAFVYRRTIRGTTYDASKTHTVSTRLGAIEVAVFWCSSRGEQGYAPYTHGIVVNGATPVTAGPGLRQTLGAIQTMEFGAFGGFLSNVRITPFVLSLAQIKAEQGYY